MRQKHLAVVLAGVWLICLAPLRAADAPPPASLDSDRHLLAWFKFDETTGRKAADSSAHSRHAAFDGSATFETHSAPGRFGNAARFDGNQTIRIERYKGIAGTGARTVSAWIKTADNAGQLVSWGTNDAGKMFSFCFIRGRVGVTPRGGYLYMKAPTSDDKWHHVAIVITAASPPNLHDDARLYLDGQPAEIDDIGLLDLWPIDTGDEQDVQIGSRYKGLMDDVRIYDRALDDAEIALLFKGDARPVR